MSFFQKTFPVAYLLKKYYASQNDQEDLVSIGTIGLIKAVDTFDPSKGIRLSSYASRCIENEILMFFRSGRKSAQDVSLSDPIETDKDGNTLTILDTMAVDDTIIDNLDVKLKSEKLYGFLQRALTPREREIVCMRYGLCGFQPQPQRVVAKRLGISRSYVWQRPYCKRFCKQKMRRFPAHSLLAYTKSSLLLWFANPEAEDHLFFFGQLHPLDQGN